MNSLKPYLKAIAGFIAPGAVLIGAAVTEMSSAGERVTTAEWVTALVACVVTSASVYSTPNKPEA